MSNCDLQLRPVCSGRFSCAGPAPALRFQPQKRIAVSQPIATLANQDLASIDRLAAAMVERLPAHLVIGLTGTLGSGKTSLTQAIARAAGVDASEVTSPTFTLLQTYRAGLTIHHLDAYRIADEDEFVELGVEELFDANAWTIVEWADRVSSVMPPETLWIRLDIESDELRTVTAACQDGQRASEFAAVVEAVVRCGDDVN